VAGHHCKTAFQQKQQHIWFQNQLRWEQKDDD